MTDATGIIVRIFFIMFALLQGESMLVSARLNNPVEEFLSNFAHANNIVARELQLKMNGKKKIQLESVVESYKEHVDVANSYEEESSNGLGKEFNKYDGQYIDLIVESTKSLMNNIHVSDSEFFTRCMELRMMLANLRCAMVSQMYTNIVNTETLEHYKWMQKNNFNVQAKPVVKRWMPSVQVLQKKVMESKYNGKDKN